MSWDGTVVVVGITTHCHNSHIMPYIHNIIHSEIHLIFRTEDGSMYIVSTLAFSIMAIVPQWAGMAIVAFSSYNSTRCSKH